MLGVTDYDVDTAGDLLLQGVRRESIGVGDTYRKTRVGVFLGEPGGAPLPIRTSAVRVPTGTGCLRCGSCMVGCRYGAKNTLVQELPVVRGEA